MRDQDLRERTGRINGLLHPPVNEWLADDTRDGAAGPSDTRDGAAGPSGSRTEGDGAEATLKPGDGRRLQKRGVMDRLMARFRGGWWMLPTPPIGATEGRQAASDGGQPGG